MNRHYLFILPILILFLLVLIMCDTKTTEPEELLAALTLLSPANGATIATVTPTLQWLAAENVTKYEATVDTSNDFTSPEFSLSSIQGTECTTDTLSSGLYYWRVRTQNGDWSEVWHFTIDTSAPVAPTLITPSDRLETNDNTPSFDWADVSDASIYELSVDNASDFTSSEIIQTDLEGSNYTSSTPLSDDIYYWKVRAKDSASNTSEWSNVWQFTIDTEPPVAPALISPSDGLIIVDTFYIPAFDWDDVDDVFYYELIVDSSHSFSSPKITQANLTSSEFYTASGTFSDATYYWKVRCRDIAGNWGDWSEDWAFILLTTLTDIDGNVYKLVKIGNQIWTAENLKVTHYRNGDPISNVTGNSAWVNLSTGAYCNYNNSSSHVANYGRLYNWYAVNDSRSIAPKGWHVPTDEEWKELEKYLGVSQYEADDWGWRGIDEGGKLKEVGTSHWKSPNTGATNESGFSALPGGYRSSGLAYFDNMGYYAYFWTSTELYSYFAWYRYLVYNYSGIYRDIDYYDRRTGFSVRLIRD